ncbi:hypothetical protein TSAR_015077 [Trichomalopsis sarcophagae]|uniref:C2 domain-containing protein n=1 Tax=Trichomalopsis sarcophagae TaxID=543379 RepID=A0A232EXQ8_9HYME|nr:hypothetical protein TSAR_015077 [Trichomalopsis sarcophagae]
MPGKIKVKILAGRNLPVMDRSGDTTDAYVEIKFGNTTYKTDVCRKSLNPQWNSEWYKFEVEDAELQDEPLQIRLMDHDTYSANDAIGKVYVNLNPLLLPGVPPPVKNIWTLEASINSSTGSQAGSVMTGWLPVYDTMHGIRGEVNIIVKVELFLDFNKFRQSSCGVTFFYSPIVPHGYHAQVIHGFVEELVVSDDPEYKWIDKIRTPRASNEARQTLFLKLSNEVQRKIGLKALDLGGNAVIGYLQNFDLEGESGIVARGIGTVVTLVKLHDFPNFLNEATTTEDVKANNKAQSSDYSESDGSPRLPPHQHHPFHHSSSSNAILMTSNQNTNANNSSNNSSTSPTQLGSKFPMYTEHTTPTPLKYVECKPPLTRQMSIQSTTSQMGRRNPLVSGSTLSLADDIIDESSLRNMLALEDMRGEPQGNRFSRGLRNLRYLPQSVLTRKNLGTLRPKGTLDSLDEPESDLESTYSSTWSICGSDTASIRSSSLLDLQQSMKKKKFTHRKNTGEGMAAMLIRSVHAGGLPLDIVKEDRETPTPSPVNFIDNVDEEEPISSKAPEPPIPEETQSLVPSEEIETSAPVEKKILLVTYTKLKLQSSEEEERAIIPMISSSESDTSTSDDDDEEDEPSESSTNYNILDDSLLDPSSPEVESTQIKLFPSPTVKQSVSQIINKEENDDDEEKVSLIDDKDEELPPPPPPPPLFENKKDEILSSEFSSDVDSDMPVSAIPYDYRTKRPTKKLSSPTRTSKPVTGEQERKKPRPEPLILSLPPPAPPPPGYEEKAVPEKSPKNSNNGGKVVRHHRLHKQLSLVQDDVNLSESSEDEYYAKKRPLLPKASQDNKKLLINLNDDESQQTSSTDQRGKSPRPVVRTDTVIYKPPAEKAAVQTPPKEKNLLDTANTELPSSPAPLVPVVTPPKVTRTISNSGNAVNNHLQVPSANLRDIVPKSPFPTESPKEGKSAFNFPDEARVAEMLMKKYRRTCMLDLIKVIDSRMLHHHSHSDSTRRRRHVVIGKRNQTPSPDSVHRRMPHHRRSRSKSPESNHHHHSKHHGRSHHASCESIVDKLPSSTLLTTSSSEPVIEEPEEVVESLNQPKTTSTSTTTTTTSPASNNNIGTTEFLEMHAIKPSTTTHSKTNVPSPETKSTNPANATDNLCVSHSPSTRRQQQNNQNQNQNQEVNSQPQQQTQGTSISPAGNQQQQKVAHSPAIRNPGIPLHRRSSDSDLSITPKGNSLTGSDRSMAGYLKPSSAIVRTMNQETLEMLEYPFITMQQYPPGFILHIGGLVSARSVKLLERISNLEEPEGRDSWWTEIRMEVRSHARALACNVVIGYKEETSISDDVCVLSGFGTAAMINLHSTGQDQDNVLITHVQGGPMTTSVDSDKIGNLAPPSASTANNTVPMDKSSNSKGTAEGTPPPATNVQQQQVSTSVGNSSNVAATPTTNHLSSKPSKQRLASESNEHEPPYVFPPSGCSLCHLPYNKSSMNFQVNVSKCAVCRRAKVPDVMFTTVELPEGIPMTGRGCFIQATVCKAKKDLRGELNAKEISDCLPFLEYELHSLLLNKLRVRGMNAAFGLKVQVSIGERLVIGMAVGTAVYLSALPPPSLPQIATGNSWHNEDQLAEIQKSLVETVKKNMEFYQLKPLPEVENGRSMSDTDESEDELPELDLGLGMKDVCVLEVDDVEDMDRISLLMDERPPNDFHVVNTESIPGLEDLEIVRNLQMFTQVSRAKIPLNQSASMPSKYFARLLQTVYFKLRRMVPCALCDLQFKIAMPEQDEIQLSVVGMALGLGEPTRYSKFRRRLLSHSMSKDQVKRQDDNDMIFSLDEDHAENGSTGDSMTNVSNTPNTQSSQTLNTGISSQKPRPRSPLRIRHTTHRHKHVPLKERYGVDITPLSYLPGGRIERYLGNLNFFFIRESNSIRENGGLSGFIHSFVTEVLAIVRAHVTALGGNAMVAFFMTQCVLLHSPHKNQGQCLINVGGDVVNVSYFGNNDGKQQQTSNAASNC